ncbi:MFS transporter [Bradyrhizobium lupini]|uniref:MFS transporter n=1 Tax=Rhizobium lupini TaxID=136996 RepID=UPI000FFC72C6
MNELDHKQRLFGLIAATSALATTFAASAAPIPLYGLYRETEGLSFFDLSLTAVAYFAGAVTALLFLGRLSNHFGRRPIVLLSLALAVAGSLVLLDVSSVVPLIVGRVLLGLSCGLASSTTTTFIGIGEDRRAQRAAIFADAIHHGFNEGSFGQTLSHGRQFATLHLLIEHGGLFVIRSPDIGRAASKCSRE